jgi:predicted peroxiredoxin
MPQELHIVLVSKDPERAYPALTLALGAEAMGVKAHIYFTMSGLEIVKKGGAAKIQLPGYPSLEKFLKDAIETGVYVCACAPSTQILEQMGVTEETLEPGVRIEEVIGFLNRALPAAKEGGLVLFV